MDKRLVLLPLMVLTITLVVGCVPKKEGDKKLSATTKAVTQVSTQEWKTYVSKYGFSVSYPKDWCLEENKNIKPTEMELMGYRHFDIYDYDPENPQSNPKSKGIVVGFTFRSDVSIDLEEKNILLSDPIEKLIFIAEKQNIYKKDFKDSIEKIKVGDLDICVIYYGGNKPSRALFYLPQKDAIATVDLNSDNGAYEYLLMLKSIKLIDEK
jgi:hypothetical protein